MRRISIRKWTTVIVVGLLVASLTGCAVCGVPILSRRAAPAPTPVQEQVLVQPTPLSPEVIEQADAEEQLLVNLYKRINPAVVHIRVITRLDVEGDVTFGAGVVVEGEVTVRGPRRVPDGEVLCGP